MREVTDSICSFVGWGVRKERGPASPTNQNESQILSQTMVCPLPTINGICQKFKHLWSSLSRSSSVSLSLSPSPSQTLRHVVIPWGQTLSEIRDALNLGRRSPDGSNECTCMGDWWPVCKTRLLILATQRSKPVIIRSHKWYPQLVNFDRRDQWP